MNKYHRVETMLDRNVDIWKKKKEKEKQDIHIEDTNERKPVIHYRYDDTLDESNLLHSC